MSNIILGIESSCDDTSAAVIRDGILLSNVIASQSVHEAFGGVVPEPGIARASAKYSAGGVGGDKTCGNKQV